MEAAAPHLLLRAAVGGKTVVVTGASDGIGARLAVRLGAAGARVVLVARTEEKLREVSDIISCNGGVAFSYIANIACEKDCERVIEEIARDHGAVDVFVSNAGRSIRRSVKYQGASRFHDFQRLMALNYFGALRLVLGILPGMVDRRAGHVVHVSSFGVPSRQPRFAGYCASKAALDAALQSAAAEVAPKGVRMSTVYMPLVQTKMVQSKGHSYDHFSPLSVDMACEYIEHAIITKCTEVIDAPTRFLALLHTFQPSMLLALNSLVYRLESEKAPDDVQPAAPTEPTSELKDKVRKPRSRRQECILRVLGGLLWFFSRLEFALCVRGGMPWLLRDILVLLAVALVIIVYPLCLAAVTSVGAFHRQRRSLRAPDTSAPVAKAVLCPTDEQPAEVQANASHGAGLLRELAAGAAERRAAAEAEAAAAASSAALARTGGSRLSVVQREDQEPAADIAAGPAAAAAPQGPHAPESPARTRRCHTQHFQGSTLPMPVPELNQIRWGELLQDEDQIQSKWAAPALVSAANSIICH